MNLRASTALLAAAALIAACTSDETPAPSATEPTPTPTPETPVDSDPVAGVDEALLAYYSQELVWEPCDDAECATVEVPLDYAEPEGETIELALLRSSAVDDPVGSLLVNPGGPGASGIDYARQPDNVDDDVRSSFDIVGFDPRGVGSSTPVDCVDDGELDELVAAEGAPGDEEELERLQELHEKFTAGCEARSGDLLPHVGTDNVARDLDVLRAVLGDSQLHYLGKSYGTFIGARYAELFPDRVGRLVLDGAVDPALSGDEFGLGQAEGIERALGAYLAWCVEQETCPLGPTEQEAYDTVDALLTAIGDDPLPTDDEARPLTQPLAVLGIILPLYLPPEQGYEVLTAALGEAQAGNGSVLLTLADAYLQRNDDGTYRNNQNEVFYAVHCIDRPDSETPTEIRASLPRFEEASPIFGPFLAWGGLACGEWPAEPQGEPAPVTASGSAPILVVGTTGDLATPYEWAESLAEQLESGVLLTYEGFVHTGYRQGNSCVDQTVAAYLVDGEVPDEGLVCG